MCGCWVLLDVSKYSTSWAAAQHEKLTQTRNGEQWPVQSELRSSNMFGNMLQLSLWRQTVSASGLCCTDSKQLQQQLNSTCVHVCHFPSHQDSSYVLLTSRCIHVFPGGQVVTDQCVATFPLSTSGCQMVSRPVWLLPLSPWVQTGYWSRVCKTSILFLSISVCWSVKLELTVTNICRNALWSQPLKDQHVCLCCKHLTVSLLYTETDESHFSRTYGCCGWITHANISLVSQRHQQQQCSYCVFMQYASWRVTPTTMTSSCYNPLPLMCVTYSKKVLHGSVGVVETGP